MRLPLLLVVIALGGCGRGGPPLEELLETGERELQQGDLEAARSHAEQGRRRALQADDPATRRAFAVLQAETLVEQRRNAEALTLLEEILRPGGPADRTQVRAYVTRALAGCRSGVEPEAFRVAEADLEQAGQVAEALGSRELAGWVTLRRGSCAVYRGDAASAEARFREALDVARSEGRPYLQVRAAGSIGFLRARAGHFDEATVWFEQVLELATGLGADLLVSRALGNLGWCYYELGDYERALAILSRMEPIAEARGQTGDLQIALTTIGNAHYRSAEYEEAGRYYLRALPIARDVGDTKGTAQLLGNLGAVAIELGRWGDAEAYLRQAREIADQLGDDTGRQHVLLAEGLIAAARGEYARAEALYRGVLESPHAERGLLWETRAALASLLVVTERRDEAEMQFREALRIMDAFRSELREAESKISFFSSLARFYDSYVAFLVDTGRPLEALHLADLSRARLLRETLHREGEAPGATSGRFQQAAAALDAVLLFYWTAPGRSFLWEVTARSVELHVLPGEAEIAKRVEAHQQLILRARDPLEEGSVEAEWLYETLAGPARASLTPGARVVVLPDGPLHRINLETLVVAAPQRHYWIEDVTLTTAPSLALLSSAAGRPGRPSGQKILLIGDAVSQSEQYPPLPNAAIEVQRVAALFTPSERAVYTGAEADPSVYRKAEPGRYSFIHFAAHAQANREIPLDSAVILSTRDDTFKLYAREIVDVPLRAELVTLSACHSAGARSFAGEGLVGLAWAFLSAGAANVIAGLWNVEDVSTSELMEELYGGLKQGLDPARALRRAKLRLLRSDGAHRKPYYWAPFGVYSGVPGLAAGRPARREAVAE